MCKLKTKSTRVLEGTITECRLSEINPTSLHIYDLILRNEEGTIRADLNNFEKQSLTSYSKVNAKKKKKKV